MDDTVKISYVRNKWETVSFSTYADSLFYGMNVVYQKMAEKGATVHYVSNGWKPTVDQTDKRLLNNFNFPNQENFYTRTLEEIFNKYPHKLSIINSITKQKNPDVVVLIGDNGEQDPKTYHDASLALAHYFESQGKKIKIYTFIHLVYKPTNETTLDLYPGQKSFINAADLALQLAENKLLPKLTAKAIVAYVVQQIQIEGKNRVYGPLVYPFFKYINRTNDSVQCRSFYFF